MGRKQKKEKTEGANRTRQNNKRADIKKIESNGSLEIPHKGREEGGLEGYQKSPAFLWICDSQICML